MRTLARAMIVVALSVAIGGFAAAGTASADGCSFTLTSGDPALDQWVDVSAVPALSTCFTGSPFMTDTMSLLTQLPQVPTSFPTLDYVAP